LVIKHELQLSGLGNRFLFTHMTHSFIGDNS